MKTKLIAVLIVLFTASIAMADMEEPCTWSVGVSGGGVFPLTAGGGALAGGDTIDNSDFDNTAAYSGNVMYRFPEGWTARIEVQHTDMDLSLDWAGTLGTLSTTPVMLLVGYQGMPGEDGEYAESGFTGHGELGGGISFNSFDKDTGMDVLDTAYPGTSDVKVNNGYVFEFGVGGDYFFNRNISTNLDIRYLVSRMDTSGWNTNLPASITKINADTGQVMLGLRYWFQ